MLARWIGRLMERQLVRQEMEPPMRQRIVRALRVVVMLFALVVALDKFGFQVAPLVAGIGVAVAHPGDVSVLLASGRWSGSIPAC